MLDPQAPIPVTMTAERWQQVLAIMGDAAVPHRVSDPLIRDIVRQCMASEQRPDNITPLREHDRLEAGE